MDLAADLHAAYLEQGLATRRSRWFHTAGGEPGIQLFAVAVISVLDPRTQHLIRNMRG